MSQEEIVDLRLFLLRYLTSKTLFHRNRHWESVDFVKNIDTDQSCLHYILVIFRQWNLTYVCILIPFLQLKIDHGNQVSIFLWEGKSTDHEQSYLRPHRIDCHENEKWECHSRSICGCIFCKYLAIYPSPEAERRCHGWEIWCDSIMKPMEESILRSSIGSFHTIKAVVETIFSKCSLVCQL